MKIRRNVVATPVRSGAEAWAEIIRLVTGTDSIDAAQLTAAASVMAALIGDEGPKNAPIVFSGSGNRLVLYCLYGDDALEAEMATESLTWNPTARSEWRITAPCRADDVEWMGKILADRAPRITVHDLAESPPEVEEAKATELTINWNAVRVR